jgi:hypothetical protein
MKSSFSVNASFYKKIKSLEEKALVGAKDQLADIARSAVNFSPVDTGAYVTSFSYTVGAGRPRGKSSANKPKYQNAQSKRDEGFSNLAGDISKAKSLEDLDQIILRNNSPHADDVEYGEEWHLTQGYFVFAQLRNLYG